MLKITKSRFAVAAMILAAGFTAVGTASADGISGPGGQNSGGQTSGGQIRPGRPVRPGRRQYVTESRPAQVRTRTHVGVQTKVVVLRYGLKLDGYIMPRGGLLVQNVTWGGPAARMRGNDFRTYSMERGDMLETINGAFLNSPADYFTAIDNASFNPQLPVRLGVRDINSGQINYFTTHLQRLP